MENSVLNSEASPLGDDKPSQVSSFATAEKPGGEITSGHQHHVHHQPQQHQHHHHQYPRAEQLPQPALIASPSPGSSVGDCDAGPIIPTDTGDTRTQVMVNAIPPQCSDGEFAQIFEQFGRLTRSHIVRDKTKTKPRGFGFVYYYQPRDAERAIRALDAFEMYGNVLKVSYANPRQDGE